MAGPEFAEVEEDGRVMPSEVTVTVRRAIVDALQAEGVEVVFALMGDANMELIGEVAGRGGMRVVFGRHEQGVVGMADGYARFTGRPAVATVTQGPGLTNTATSLVVARRRRSPVLLLAGEAPLGDLHNPQGFDQLAFGQLMAGQGGRVESVRSLDDLLVEAFTVLRSDLPYMLSLPADVQRADLGGDWRRRRQAGPMRAVPEPELSDRAAQLLADADHPVVLAGQGAVVSGAGQVLGELGTLLGAPLATTLLANGLFAGHPLEAGVSGGLGDGRALRALDRSDLVLVVGASLNQWTTHFGSALAGKQVIRVDSDPGALLVPGDDSLALLGDAAATAGQLTARLRQQISSPRTARPEPAQPRDPAPYLDTQDSLDPRHFLAELDRVLPAQRSIVIGGGHSAQVACFTLRASSPADWECTSVDFGALGQALAVAAGACFARPGQRVVHVTGDGEFMMGLSELDTAIRYSLPLTIFVLNDQAMGQERHNLTHAGLPPEYAAYPSPNFAALAAGFAATGYRIDGPDALDRGLQQALKPHDGVVIVDVPINGGYLNPVSRDIAEHLG